MMSEKRLKNNQGDSIGTIYDISRRERMNIFDNKAKVLILEDLIKVSLLGISSRYTNNQLPTRISNLFSLTNHNYYTRNRNNLKTVLHTSSIYNKSFLGQAASIWLSLSKYRNITSLMAFHKSVKKLIIKNY